MSNGINNNKTTGLNIIAIIPAYNESQNIEEIIVETSKYVNSVIVVDDGSNDNTSSIARKMGAKVIRNEYNMGKGEALKKGFLECYKYNADIIVALDADGQHTPSDMPSLIEPIETGKADIVIGSRFLDGNSKLDKDSQEIPQYRQRGLSFINYINNSLTSNRIKDTQSGFRVYSLKASKIVPKCRSTGYGIETEQLSIAESNNYRILEVPVKIKYQGLNNTSKKNSVLHGMDIISIILKLAIERRPLLFFGLGGLILIICGLITSAFVLTLFNDTRYFSIPFALMALGFVFVGTSLLFLSFMLYAINQIKIRIDD